MASLATPDEWVPPGPPDGTRILDRLRAVVATLPPGALLPRDWLLEQLAATSPTPPPSAAPAAPPRVDLTVGDLARLFGKQPSTVRGWVERGDFPGAYKLHGKEWRVPASSIEAFQERYRTGPWAKARAVSRLSGWRTAGQ